MNPQTAYYYRNLEKERLRGRLKYQRKVGTLEGCADNLLRGAKQRAKKKGLPFDLTLDWVMERLHRGECEVTSIPFNFDGGKNPFGPTIDRIVPQEGYTKENCQVVVWTYNAAKGNGTHEDVLILARALHD